MSEKIEKWNAAGKGGDGLKEYYLMYAVGERIIYSENGVCTVEKIAPLEMSGADDKLYYHLRPLVGSGVYFAPVDTKAFMRPVMSREAAEAFIQSIPDIEPAVCRDNRFNHVDAFYKELFKLHTCEALVSIVKGLKDRMTDRRSKSSRAEATMKRAKDMLHGELATALEIEIDQVEAYIAEKLGQR